MYNQIIKNNQLTFVDGRFYVDETGQYFPSVTTILEAYPKPFALMQWIKENGENADKIRDAAGERGSAVHHLTEDYDNGLECNLLNEQGNPQHSLEVWGMFEKYVDFSTRYSPVHELIEQNIISSCLGFAGTIDRVSTIYDKKYVLDLKTSNMIANSYWLQMAAYRDLLYVETGIKTDGVAILWLNAKTRTTGAKGDIQGVGWQLITKEDTISDMILFNATKQLWIAEHENDKPKSFSYQLTHQKP